MAKGYKGILQAEELTATPVCLPGRILLSNVSINQNTFSSSFTTSNIRPAMKFRPCTQHVYKHYNYIKQYYISK